MAQHDVVICTLAAVIVIMAIYSMRRTLLVRDRARTSGVPVPTSTTVSLVACTVAVVAAAFLIGSGLLS